MIIDNKKIEISVVCEIPENKEIFIHLTINGKMYKGYLNEIPNKI